MDAYDITASALTAQRLRLDVISSNLANVNTTRRPDGSIGAYRRKNVVFAPIYEEASRQYQAGQHKAGDLPMKPAQGGMTTGPDGRPVFRLSATFDETGPAGVQVTEITEDTRTPARLVYDPSHPDANKDGYVEMPNVNLVSEMVDMISASRAYEANVTALQSAKSMNQAALEI